MKLRNFIVYWVGFREDGSHIHGTFTMTVSGMFPSRTWILRQLGSSLSQELMDNEIVAYDLCGMTELSEEDIASYRNDKEMQDQRQVLELLDSLGLRIGYEQNNEGEENEMD